MTAPDRSTIPPVSVYLDSRDYSALSDPKRVIADPELLKASKHLQALIADGKVALIWSAVHAMEMSPASETLLDPAIRRLNAMFILSEGTSFMDPASIAKIELRLQAQPKEGSTYALGQWLPNSALPGYNLNPGAYVENAKAHGFDPTAFRASMSTTGIDLTATMKQIQDITKANPNAFDPRENDTNFADMLFKAFTGSTSEIPAHAIGCRCMGGVMRRLCLSASTPRRLLDSDHADIWHSFYAPYVEIWSGDDFMAPIVRSAWPPANAVSGSFPEVVAAIQRKVDERFS